jgi:hypothetical protein
VDYREMVRLASDPVRVRATAEFLLHRGGDDSPRMRAFLTDLARYDGSRPLTTRQLETLYSLRERTSRTARAGRYRAATLVSRACDRRHDLLDDDAEDWLMGLNERGPEAALTRREWLRLLALCRRLEIVDGGEWVPL